MRLSRLSVHSAMRHVPTNQTVPLRTLRALSACSGVFWFGWCDNRATTLATARAALIREG